MQKINRLITVVLTTCFYSSMTFAGTLDTVPVPEPGITALIGLGVAAAYFIAKGRKK